MTTRDEIISTFRNLEEPAIKERLDNIREISERLIGILGGISPRIDLGEEPVIVVTESITPTELMEMDKEKILAIVTHHGSDISHAAILAKTMNIPILGVIENYSYLKCPDCGKILHVFGESHLEETAAELGLTVAGKMPIDPALAQAADAGEFAKMQNTYLKDAADILHRLKGRKDGE